MKKTVSVIGAGVSGLSLSIFLLEQGYDVSLYEKNDKVGGLCSGFYVNGHYVDHCIHWLMGTNKNSKLYSLWNKIDALNDKTNIISLPILGEYIYKGKKVTFYRDIERTRRELIELSTIDTKAINKFVDAIKSVSSIMDYVLANPNNKNKLNILQLLPHSRHILKTMKESREEYSKRFKHPAIRFAIKNAQTGYNNMFFFFDLYGIFIKGNADVPEGGALYMMERIQKRFLDLGGHLYLNSNIEKVIIENNNAIGISVNGKDVFSDIVVSCLDMNYTLSNLLSNQYQVRKLNNIVKKEKKYPVSSTYCLYLAVEGNLENIGVPTCIHTKNIKIGKNLINSLLIRPYYYDPKYFVHDNKTVVSVFVDQTQEDFNYFNSLTKEDYKKSKNRINKEIINAVIKQYPELNGKIEYLTEFTPISLNKWANTKYGALQGYSFTNKNSFYIISSKIKELKNFYMCSQWNRSIGGTPTAIESADVTAKLIIKENS